MKEDNANKFMAVYDRLLGHYGEQNWWPADSPFEVMVGAILTQNTNWGNVEKAIANLRGAGCLEFQSMLALDQDYLAELIRPSGYYNIKARRLKNLLEMVADEYEGEIDFLFGDSLDESRRKLLSVKGIGPETADSILLYGAGKPIFVIDAYTHRIFSRHNLVSEDNDYYSLQQEFMDRLPLDVQFFNEYHALIVMAAKEFCKKGKPRCRECPLHGVGGEEELL